MSAGAVDVLAVLDAMVVSAERLNAGEPVTSCAATVEVAKRTRAAVTEAYQRACDALQLLEGIASDHPRTAKLARALEAIGDCHHV